MWRPVIPAAILLAIVLTIDWPHPHGRPAPRHHLQPLSARAARVCAVKAISDWVRDDRIDGNYRRECYETALAMMPQDGYGLEVENAVRERLRALG